RSSRPSTDAPITVVSLVFLVIYWRESDQEAGHAYQRSRDLRCESSDHMPLGGRTLITIVGDFLLSFCASAMSPKYCLPLPLRLRCSQRFAAANPLWSR